MDEENDGMLNRLLQYGLFGAMSGGGMGAYSGALGRFRRASDVIKPALTGAATGGGLSATAGYVGEDILGPPGEDEASPNTVRGGLGGMIIGAGAGAVGGAAVGSGLGNKVVNKMIPDEENLIRKGLENLQSKGRLRGAGKLGLIGAPLGAIMLGNSESGKGITLDVAHNEIKSRRQKQEQEENDKLNDLMLKQMRERNGIR